MRVYHNFFLVLGSRSTFPDADPDPGQWYGSETLMKVHTFILPIMRVHTFILPILRAHTFILPIMKVHAFILPIMRVHTFILLIMRAHTIILPIMKVHTFILPIMRVHTFILPIISPKFFLMNLWQDVTFYQHILAYLYYNINVPRSKMSRKRAVIESCFEQIRSLSLEVLEKVKGIFAK